MTAVLSAAPRHELRVRAMGTEGHIVVIGGPADGTVWAAERIEQLEARWSRFRPDSEVSRINASPDEAVPVSADTYLLAQRAVEAWLRTRGRFDATVLHAVVSSGYDRTFPLVAANDDAPVAEPEPSPGSDEIELDAVRRTVRVPDGVGIDPGGIGKGLAADLVVAELIERGAAGACVNLGGDVRVAGEAPTDEGWIIGVADQYDTDRLLAAVPLADGGIVTSTRLMRRWRRAGRQYHHLIDPTTGGPTETSVDAVTVMAGDAWWAEALTKAVFVGGADEAASILASAGAAGVVFAGVDDVRYLGAMESYRL